MLGKASVKRRRAEAVQAWSASLGDVTACAIAKDGGSYPAGKFHEGRVAALGELMRRLDDASTPGQVVESAAALAEEWEGRVQPGAGASREWESYRAGGVQALQELAAG